MGCEFTIGAKITTGISVLFFIVAGIMYILTGVMVSDAVGLSPIAENVKSWSYDMQDTDGDKRENPSFNFVIKQTDDCSSAYTSFQVTLPSGEIAVKGEKDWSSTQFYEVTDMCGTVVGEASQENTYDPPLREMASFSSSYGERVYDFSSGSEGTSPTPPPTSAPTAVPNTEALGTYKFDCDTSFWVVDKWGEIAEGAGGVVAGLGMLMVCGILVCFGVILACVAACCCCCGGKQQQKQQVGQPTVMGQPTVIGADCIIVK